MKIAISGASGFIGTSLTGYFEKSGNTVIALSRSFFQDAAGSELKNALEGVDVVINLAGEPINRRWSEPYKLKMYDSRISTTRKIVDAINSLDNKPNLFISASAVGYYPAEGNFTEYNSANGKGFLSDLCREWENEARKVSPGVRLAITRFGVVISKNGGAYKLISLPMKAKIAAVIAPGYQPFAWIYLEDLIRGIDFIIERPELKDIINFVSPEQSTNKEFTVTMAVASKCFMTITIPQFLLNIVLGETGSLLTEGQRVVPQKLSDSGFKFIAPSVSKLAKALYG